MPSLLRDGQLVDDNWLLWDESANTDTAALVPLARLLEAGPGSAISAVYLKPEDDARALTPYLAQLERIGVVFASFMDGRGFSQARQLREVLGYQGELAALGSYIQDQLFFMKRCGFDRFQLPEGSDPERWRASLNDFSETYQAASDQPLPLFRRRQQRIA